MNRFLSIFNINNFWNTVLYFGIVSSFLLAVYFESCLILLSAPISTFVFVVRKDKVQYTLNDGALSVLLGSDSRKLNRLAILAWPVMVFISILFNVGVTDDLLLSLIRKYENLAPFLRQYKAGIRMANVLLPLYLYSVWFNIPISIFFNPKIFKGRNYSVKAVHHSGFSTYTTSPTDFNAFNLSTSPVYRSVPGNIHYRRRHRR